MNATSPAYDSKSNGLAERNNKTIEALVRKMLPALEARRHCKLSTDECVLPWSVVHAAELLNHVQVGEDDKVTYRRLRQRTEHPASSLESSYISSR